MKRSRPLSVVPALSSAGVLLLIGLLAFAGCGNPESERAEQPAKPPTVSKPPRVSAPPIGMDLRYLDDDGTVKTIRVEDLNP